MNDLFSEGLKREHSEDSLHNNNKRQKPDLNSFVGNVENKINIDFLDDALYLLMDPDELNQISDFIVPNLKILHKMAVLSLRIMNLIFSNSQATYEKQSLLNLLYGKKEEFNLSTNKNEADQHANFTQLIQLFLKLWFEHFNKRVFNNVSGASEYEINSIKKKDVFLSYGDVFEIFNKYSIYDDLLLLPTPLLYNQFLFFFHNNKSLAEANLEKELRVNHIKNDINGNNLKHTDPASFDFFIKHLDGDKDVDLNVNYPELSVNDIKLLIGEDNFEEQSGNTDSYLNAVLSIPFKVQYHMFQLLQKINFCMFMLISLRLTPHDLTIVDKFVMEAMNGNVQPIQTSKKFKLNTNSSLSTQQLQTLNKCKIDDKSLLANSTFRFFDLNTRKLIDSSAMIDKDTAKLINDKAIISDGDSYQVFIDKYQSKLYNSMYNGNSVRSIKKILKGHINILVEFKTQIFVYELEKYNVSGKHSFQTSPSTRFNPEANILSKVFDVERVKSDIKYLKKTQDSNIINGTEQNLIDKLEIRHSNLSKKINSNDNNSKSIIIQDLIKHYEWFDFAVLFVQFLEKKFFQMNNKKENKISLVSNRAQNLEDCSYLPSLFNTNHSNSGSILSSTVNSAATTPVAHFSEPCTPQGNQHNYESATSSTGHNSTRIINGDTGATTPLYRKSATHFASKSIDGNSSGNLLSPQPMSPDGFLTTANNPPTPLNPESINLENDENPVVNSSISLTGLEQKKVPRNLWKEEEEEALIQGLKICGPSWSQILELYGTGGFISNALKNRKYLQLKDKARNWKVWFYTHGLKVIPPYFLKVTGGAERSVTNGYKIKRLMLFNNQSPVKCTPALRKKTKVSKKKLYQNLALRLEKFLYTEADLCVAKKVKVEYTTNFIETESMDVNAFNEALNIEIETLKSE
ncbi:hypothetical protein QEN19_001477 [Hanseniaspora menglaensis]